MFWEVISKGRDFDIGEVEIGGLGFRVSLDCIVRFGWKEGERVKEGKSGGR